MNHLTSFNYIFEQLEMTLNGKDYTYFKKFRMGMQATDKKPFNDYGYIMPSSTTHEYIKF